MAKIVHRSVGNKLTRRPEYEATNSHVDESGNTLAVSRSVTLVVAASNASASSKAGADYVCDGTADQVQIQVALNAVETVQGRVLLSEGTFTISSLIQIPDYCTLEGQGYGTLIYMANGSNTNPLYGKSTPNATHITIANLRVDQNGLNQTSGVSIRLQGGSKHYIYNVWALNGYYNCISIQDSEDCVIENSFCSASTTDGQCITVNNSTNVRIVNPNIDGGLQQGIYIHASEDIQIIGGNIKNISGAAGLKWAVYIIGDCKRVSVVGLTLTDCWSGIANISDGGIISACTAYNIGDITVGTGNAFDISIGRGGKIIGCTAKKVVEGGIVAEGVGQVVTGNTVEYSGVGGGFLHMKRGIVSNNTIKNSKGASPRGLIFYGTIGNLCEKNLVYGNQCFDDADTSITSLLTSDAALGQKDVIVANASLFEEGQPVTIDDDTPDTESNVIDSISGNTLTMEADLSNTYTTGQNAKVTVRKSQTYGIYEHTYAEDNAFRDNRCTDNLTGQVRILAESSKMLSYRQHSDLFMDVLAVSVDYVRNNEDLSAGIPITFTIDAQPDVPRTLSWVLVHANITEYDMEIIGIDAKGNAITETWDETAGWSGETSNAFAVITSIKMTSRTGTGAGDTMDIGITDVLGLSNIIYETGDVYKIKKNNANAVVAGAQVGTTYNTYDMSVIGLGATDDFTIWYRSNLNTIS